MCCRSGRRRLTPGARKDRIEPLRLTQILVGFFLLVLLLQDLGDFKALLSSPLRHFPVKIDCLQFQPQSDLMRVLLENMLQAADGTRVLPELP